MKCRCLNLKKNFLPNGSQRITLTFVGTTKRFECHAEETELTYWAVQFCQRSHLDLPHTFQHKTNQYVPLLENT